MLREKAKWLLHKCAACCFEQILEAAPQKTAGVWAIAFHLTNNPRPTRHAEHCQRSRVKLISKVLLWVLSLGNTSVGQPVNTYIHQVCADTGCHLADQLIVMDDRGGWWESQIGLVWFNGISTVVGYFMPNPIFTYVLNIWFVNPFCRYTQLIDQTVLFLTNQFSISDLFVHSLNVKERTLSGAITLDQSGPGSDCIPQSSSITGASPSNHLLSYIRYSLG